MLIVIFSLIAIIIMMRMCAYALKQRSRERKIKTLKDNKVFLENLFSNLSVAVAVRDIQDGLRFLFWNKEAEHIFGVSRKEVMENMDAALSSSEMMLTMNRNDLEILEKDKRFSGLSRFDAPDGSALFLYVNKRIISHPDGRRWLLMTAWDMTEQQQNVEKLAELNKRLQTVLSLIHI